MKPDSDPDARLERLIDQVLRDLPPRRAPRTLQMRVLAEIERRSRMAWWRNGFTYWPVTARLAVLMVSMVAASFVVTQVARVFAELASASWLTGVAQMIERMQIIAGALISVADSIPSSVIWGVLALVTVMYVALFGISAFAYRVLYAGR